MRIFYLFIVVLMLLLTSCREEKKTALPADLIAREKFIAVLTDVRLLEGAYSTRYAKVDTSAIKIESYYQQLFDAHGITREAFRNSYRYYASDQPMMLNIEEIVVAKLTGMESSRDSLQATINQHHMDSLAHK